MSQQSNIQDIVRAVVANLGNLPSGSSINSSTNSTNTSNLNSNSSTSEELNRSFQIPRGSRSMASGFSSRENYGPVMRRPRSRRSVPQTSRSSTSGRFQPYSPSPSSGSGNGANEAGTYYKDICLLPSPTWECVPRGKVKITLIQKDMYIDAWPVCRGWDESTLRREVGRLFRHVLNSNVAEPIG